MNMPFTSEPMENCGISDRDQHFGESLKRIQLPVGKRYVPTNTLAWPQFWSTVLHSQENTESTKIRPNFIKQTIPKIEVIKRCYQHKLLSESNILNRKKNWNDYKVLRFYNRWRHRRGRFNFRQIRHRTLYQRSLQLGLFLP